MRVYLVRHGHHDKNVLTPKGITRMMAAAQAIAADAVDHGVAIGQIGTHSSQEPRAVISAGVLAAELNIRVTGLPLVAFNPANGLGKAITEGRLPQPGEGFVRQWHDHGCEGVEEFTRVGQRAMAEMLTIGTFGPIVVATHGGVIEPLVHGMTGADDHDMVEGEVAVVEDNEETGFTVSFLNGKLPE